MIAGLITLEQVDQMYRLAGLKELVVVPWYEDCELVALVTGFIEERPDFPGEKVGFLEHFIVLPEAKRKLEVMQLFPSMIYEMCRERGIERLVLCIHHDHPKSARLAVWARRCKWYCYGTTDVADWYTISLK